MKEKISDQQLKICCAAFYQSDLARIMLGEVFHPGGLELTGCLGRAIQLHPGDQVLDIACGRGHSAVHLAKTFECHVTGLDYGVENIEAAEAHAGSQGVNHLVEFHQGDAEAAPFEDGSPGGRMGLTDMTVAGQLPEDIDNLLSWVACIAGAGTAQEYVKRLESAGLTDFFVEDRPRALLDLVTDIRRKLLGLELAAGLGKQGLGTSAKKMDFLADLDLTEGKRLAKIAEGLIAAGDIGYTLITATKR